MVVIWVMVAFSMLAGAYTLIDAESAPIPQGPSPATLAMNMSEYRQAVVAFAAANPSFVGSVSPANLQPYLGAVIANPMWQNYVAPNAGYAGSLVVVYALSAAAGAVVPAMEELAQGSELAGVALGTSVVSPGNPAVLLPSALANAIPNGMPVWMAQAYD